MATIKFKRGTTNPTGLTAGEPAFRTDTDQFYIHDGVTAIWVGALISTGDIATGSTLTVPTQSAVKAYVDSNIAGGAVTSVSGVTGAVLLGAGTGITLSTSSKTITITNTGVHSFNGSTGAVSFANYVASAVAGSGISVSGSTGTVTISNTGVTGLVAGTAISLSGTTGNITVTNNGVQSLTGTTNQITVSGSTGAVTLSLPSTVTVPGALNVTTNLTVTGNLTVNGNTTTVNSDVMTVDDPIIVLGLSGGLPLTVSDGGKDRGVAFTYFNTAGKTGFFGYDASADAFGFWKDATISGDVVTGLTLGDVYCGSLYVGGVESAGGDQIVTSGQASVLTIPDFSGVIIVADTASATAGYILSPVATGTEPQWINPNASGFTAFAATKLATARNIALTGNVTATGVAFDGTAGITLTTVIPSSTVTNAMLVNSGFTLGTTNITLGSTGLTLAGMSSITSTTFTGALTGNASTATALQTARTFSLTGNVTATGITFDGTNNVALNTTIGSGVVTNAMLVNSGFTLGTTNITLGSTGLTLAGLSSVTATTFNGSLNGTASTATNVTTTEASGTIYLAGATGVGTSVGLQVDTTATALSYAISTGTLTCIKVEAIVDGGSY